MENNINMGAITLPTLSPQAILLLTDNDVQLASDLWFLTNNDYISGEETNRLKPMIGSRYSLLKDYKITEMKANADGSKKNATKDTLEILLSQSVFGRTGGLVRLPHSGFSVKLKPLTGTDRVDLQHNIAENIIRLHRDLTGDIQTSIYVTVYEHIIDLFISKIEYTTLDAAIKNIKKYIRVKDLGIIKLALLDMIFPDGYDFNYVCGELKIDNDNHTICGNKSDVYKIRMNELLYLSDELTDSEYQQLMNDTKNSITVDEVKKYQERFKYNEPASFDIDGNTFKIDPGTVDVYIDKSKEWLKSNIIESPIFSDDMDIKILQNLISVSKLGLYYYTISSIENSSYIASRDNITLTHVNILSSREDFSEIFIEAAKRSLLYSYYQIGIPKYTCPECTARLTEIDDNNIEETEVNDKISVGRLDNNEKLFTNLNLLDLFSFLV